MTAELTDDVADPTPPDCALWVCQTPAEHRCTCPLGDQCPSAGETALAADPDPTPAEVEAGAAALTRLGLAIGGHMRRVITGAVLAAVLPDPARELARELRLLLADWQRLEAERDRLRTELADQRAAAKQARHQHIAATSRLEDRREAELATARRDGVADALKRGAAQLARGEVWADTFGRWTAAQAEAAGAQKQLMVDRLLTAAAEVRAGTRTIPTTTEETDHDAH